MAPWVCLTGTSLLTFTNHTLAIYAAALSPDGTRALSCSTNAEMRYWDVSTGMGCCASRTGQDGPWEVGSGAGAGDHSMNYSEPRCCGICLGGLKNGCGAVGARVKEWVDVEEGGL